MLDGRILAIEKRGGLTSHHYVLPGGAQDPGETLHQALVRECEEEIGVRVQVIGLIHVADYFNPRKTVPPSTRHQVEFFFKCTVPDSYVPRNGSRPDKRQTAVAWLDIEQPGDKLFSPDSVRRLILEPEPRDRPVYIGELSRAFAEKSIN